MGDEDGEINATVGAIKPNGEITGEANAIPTKDEEDAGIADTAASTADKQAPAPGETASDLPLAHAEIAKAPCVSESAAAIDTASVGQGVDGVTVVDPQNNGGAVDVAELAAKVQVDDEKERDGPDQGDDVCDNDEYDDDLSSSVEGGKDGWADVEDGERTGYSGAHVEPFAVQEGINGSCILEVWQQIEKECFVPPSSSRDPAACLAGLDYMVLSQQPRNSFQVELDARACGQHMVLVCV